MAVKKKKTADGGVVGDPSDYRLVPLRRRSLSGCEQLKVECGWVRQPGKVRAGRANTGDSSAQGGEMAR